MRIGISFFGCAGGKTKGSGISVYAKNLIKNLAAIDKINDYYIFLSKDNKRSFVYVAQGNLHFKIIPVGETGISRVIFEQFILPVLCLFYRVDIVHYIMPRMPFVNFTKSVVTVHDLMYKFYNENFKGYVSNLKYKYFNACMKRVMKKADKIIAVSKYTALAVENYFKRGINKINVIYEGVDPEFFKSPNGDSAESKPDRSEGYILAVKSGFPHKNLKSVLSGYVLAKKKYNFPHKLVVLGDSTGMPVELSRLLKDSGKGGEVVFMNSVTEKSLIDMYKNAALFISLSLNEGFGLPVLEAMAAGVPVICSDRASFPEIVGEAAVIVDPLNVDKISEAINTCLNDDILTKKMVDEGIRRARRFSWEQTALQTLELYNAAAYLRR
ncbi:MAG: glycosyltransferase family 1 protein [Candidatus Omnitrophica bacterium]|jgi:glycosyltransferase involved in cell wall biosynthesis|nr:glycosyltransferase family 1 protein [Candidatus Omnitrophota bacterium]